MTCTTVHRISRDDRRLLEPVTNTLVLRAVLSTSIPAQHPLGDDLAKAVRGDDTLPQLAAPQHRAAVPHS